jgi:heat shock protein HslJ/uncharacterized lipoprotein NlpE involved in copper resistance
MMKRLVFCMGAAVLLLACQAAGDRTGSATRIAVPERAGPMPAAASGDADRLPENQAQRAPGEAADLTGLALPATFTGTLPCADCEGIRYHLDLWPDGVFHLRRIWLGTPGIEDDIGRWRKDPLRPVIFLHGGREMPLQFQVRDPHTLRLLDLQGRAVDSDLPYDLTAGAGLTPTEVRLGLHGMFRYLADAARFEECLTGRSYPVAMEGDYLQLERAYLQAAKPRPGAPLMVSFEGGITCRPAMERNARIPTVVVRRFIAVRPKQRCERAMSRASLPNQYWRIVSLGGEEIKAAESRPEPHLILRSDESRYAATVGCNRLVGSYTVDGDTIVFTSGASTLMACPPPLEQMERKLSSVLRAARSWSITGKMLKLLDETGTGIAVFEAVYLR